MASELFMNEVTLEDFQVKIEEALCYENIPIFKKIPK